MFFKLSLNYFLIYFTGAFIFPFLIMMVLEGMPLVLLELAVGQKFRQGSFGVWNMIHPWLGGIGVGSTVIAVIVGCYYNMIIAWCIYYLGNSFWVRYYQIYVGLRGMVQLGGVVLGSPKWVPLSLRLVSKGRRDYRMAPKWTISRCS